MDEITHEITLDSDLTEEPRERFLEIANRCPVHRALTKVCSYLSDDGAL